MKTRALDPRELKFVQAHMDGLALGPAWKAAGYKARGHAAQACAHKKLNEPRIAAEIKRRKDALRDASLLTKTDLVHFLCEVITTPVGAVDPDHRLAQEAQISESETGSTTRTKMPSKMDAARELAKLLDWYAPVKVTVPADDPFHQLLSHIRDGSPQ